MAAGEFARSLRRSSFGAWLVLALTVIVPLVAVYWLVLLPEWPPAQGATSWSKTCELSLPFRGIIEVSCSRLRIASFVVSAAGAFVVTVLLWWLLNELIGLRRIFEVPWFGVGDDVENVGVVESIVRAGIFVVVVWIALGLCALAFVGLSGRPSESKETDKTSGRADRQAAELAALAAATAAKLAGEVNGIRDQQTGRPQAANPRIVPELQRLGASLHDIQVLLTSQDRKLDALRQIDGRLTRWEHDRNDAAVLDETRRLGGTLGEVRSLLDAQGRRLAALDNVERFLRDLDTKQVPAITGEVGELIRTVGEVQRRARAQTKVLERIELLLKRNPDAPRDNPPPRNEASCSGHGEFAVREVSSAAMPRRYSRTLLVFFDKAGAQLTPGALDSLGELAEELRRVEQPVVSILGSADAQGAPGRSAQYAEQRAHVVKQFLQEKVPELTVQATSSRSTDPPPSEPYNRVARVEASGICR